MPRGKAVLKEKFQGALWAPNHVGQATVPKQLSRLGCPKVNLGSPNKKKINNDCSSQCNVLIIICLNHVDMAGLFDGSVSNDQDRLWEVGLIRNCAGDCLNMLNDKTIQPKAVKSFLLKVVSTQLFAVIIYKYIS